MDTGSDQKDEESALFRAFLEISPNFAGEQILKWSLAAYDPPDIICVTASGKRIGVEVSQWAHEGEMGAGKLREKIESKLRDAIGIPQPLNRSKNFKWVGLFPMMKVHITPAEYPDFRKALLAYIQHADRAWPTYKNCLGDLRQFPPLDRHLAKVRCKPGKPMDPGIDWILFPPLGDTFDDNTMLRPLLDQFQKKKTACGSLKTACEEICLLIAHDEALLYCSPLLRVEDKVKKVALLADGPGPFSRVFVLIARDPDSRVYRLF
jgi:hypothetical protein